jgi:hypothetical protein
MSHPEEDYWRLSVPINIDNPSLSNEQRFQIEMDWIKEEKSILLEFEIDEIDEVNKE